MVAAFVDVEITLISRVDELGRQPAYITTDTDVEGYGSKESFLRAMGRIWDAHQESVEAASPSLK